MSNTATLWLIRIGLFVPFGPKQMVDPLGRHRLGCRIAAGARTSRLDGLVELISKVAKVDDPQAFQVA